MVRRHGWQLPADTLQVIAVTVFCLLVVAYYAFLAPFAGGRVWEYVLIGVYSPVALLVFVLYVRCSAINPADPRIMSIFDLPHPLSARDISRDFNETGSQLQSCPSVVSMSSTLAANSSVRGSLGDDERADSVPRKSCYNPLAILCCVFVLEDCWKQEEQQGDSSVGLYCMLCNSEVHKSSKHCRSCDKCVVGIDHHCKWLNNCVGRKNYMTFVSLMTACLLWLIIEAAVGIAVIVRVFADKKRMETEIVDRLGSSFSLAPLAAVVGVCTVVTSPACYHLSQLLFFHTLLIKKGLTTYDYLLAMRAMSEAPAADEEIQSVLYSPTGSATTGFSGGSSLGPSYKKGVWCTPPRVFDNQDEVMPQLDSHMVPSTVDPDTAERGIKAPKRSVKRSAWKLAKLDANEAARAAARARASSSVMRPIHNPHFPDNELSSIGTVSIISSVSTDANVAARKELLNNELKPSLSRNLFAAPRKSSRDEYDTGNHGMNNESVTLTPLPQYSTVSGHRFSATTTHHMHRGNNGEPLFLSAPPTSLPRDVRKTSIVWDPEAGRYVSSAPPVTTMPEVRNRNQRPPILPPQGSSSVSSALKAPLPLQQAERRLMIYTGDSIFFGGPLVNIPTRNNPRRSEVREGQERLASTLHQDARYRRDSTSHQLPVFAPAL
ncbi:hypothetical protein Bca52824_020538 [Brassica carinata]|uniref:S-acyltransferase n=1 Tax=Brassica carinata TaxID=52824 RepID=A0A8X7VTJ0_BRACI|nr:hypothetical protein Bca52824_020538 [Brassica carinata]